jgi:transcriptional regulator with XRE-family HTH domain
MSDVNLMTVGPNESDNPIFGQLLNDLRTSKRLSRSEAGKRLKVSSEYIRLIERGERVPALGTTIQMLEVYGVPYTHTNDRLFFENASVKFTSRIKKSRSLIRYAVTQERTVYVTSTDPVNAALLATRIFKNEKKQADRINVDGPVREVSLKVEERR